jgi:hypothetical protein
MISGRSVWLGSDLLRDGDWIHTLNDTHLREIDAALARVRGAPLFGFARKDFPLRATAALLAHVTEELEHGYGCARVRGLPVARYTSTELQQVFWGIGLHLGTAVYQSAAGEIMGELRDCTRDQQIVPTAATSADSAARATAGSRARLRFHTDGADVAGLLCVRPAQRGGETKLASAATVYNEMRRLRPDLLEVLFAEKPAGDLLPARSADMPATPQPVFGMRDGRITTQLVLAAPGGTSEERAVALPEDAWDAALEMHADIAEATCLQAPFVAGDMQFVNNHTVYHARTAFQDCTADRDQIRLMLRLWLSVPGSRALPAEFQRGWGNIAAGALRGGIAQPDGSRAPRPPAPLRRIA